MQPDDSIARLEAESQEHLSEIQARKSELNHAYEQAQQTAHHVRSPYFRDALRGVHPYLWTTTDRQEYFQRHAHFAAPIREKVREWSAAAQELPVVSEQRWDTPRDITIGIIADQFLYNSLEGSARLVPVTPTNYGEQISQIDLLLITSTWRGLHNEWLGLGAVGSEQRALVDNTIVEAARAAGVPVVFYSKEDPPNFRKFCSTSEKADAVFTTAVEVVRRYKNLARPGVPVGVLPFAVNFRHHNPLGSMRHQGREFVFAGSWMRHKYASRRESAQIIFDGLIDAGADFTIIDRNLGLDPAETAHADRYLFPERFVPHLHGPLPHETLLNIQRLLPVGINLNSVTASQTMFANRVLELQAMGTLVVSNYSAGVNSQFPNVLTPDSQTDVAQIVDRVSSDAYLRGSQLVGIRHAYSANTAVNRIDEIAAAVGIRTHIPEHRVLLTGASEQELGKFVSRQTFSDNVELVSESSKESIHGSIDGDVHVDLSRVGRVGPNFLQDLVNAFRYSDADSVTAKSVDHQGPLFEFSDHIEESVATWVPSGASIKQARAEAGKTLTIAADLPLETRPTVTLNEPELSIIVPVYNNGKHLLAKCFESIRRSSVFSRAKMLLIDDGSTDLETVASVDLLGDTFPNVEIYRFPKGGSGSASRPRNKGLELVKTPFVTYLDPDNEQTHDGYAHLLEIMKSGDYQFAIGNMLRHKGRKTLVNNATRLSEVVDEAGYLNENALSEIKYAPMSIQALVARTEWLRSLELVQPEGAVGQDSYFFQQMLYYATRIGVTSRPIHTYYAEVTNSTVNNISSKFFKKYIPLEKARAKWLREVGLLDDYNGRRLEPYYRGWMFNKLKLVHAEDRDESMRVIKELVSYFGKTEWEDPDIAELLGGSAPA